MGMFDGIAGFGVTFSTMFRKVVTEEYPRVKKVTAPRYHGRHQLNRHPDGLEKCVGCELCAWACPADAIYVEGGDNTDEERYSPGERYGAIYQINYLRCIGCGLCIEACPTRSLTMTNEYELADDDRQDLIYTKDTLLAPLLPGMEQPPHPMRLGENEQDYYVQGPEMARRARTSRTDRRDDRTIRRRAGRVAGGAALAGEARPRRRHGGGEHDAPARPSPSGSSARSRWPAGSGMVFSRNAVHSALWLVMTMLSLGVLYMVQSGAVPGLHPDHRLHRRDHDAVRLRADDGRPRLVRLRRRDAARAAASRRPSSASGSRPGRRRVARRRCDLSVTVPRPRDGPEARATSGDLGTC